MRWVDLSLDAAFGGDSSSLGCWLKIRSVLIEFSVVSSRWVGQLVGSILNDSCGFMGKEHERCRRFAAVAAS